MALIRLPAAAQEHFGRRPETLRKWIRSGNYDGPTPIRINGHIMFDLDEVKAWIESHRDDNGEVPAPVDSERLRAIAELVADLPPASVEQVIYHMRRRNVGSGGHDDGGRAA